MSSDTSTRCSGVFGALGAALLFPVRFLHELSHAVAASRYGEDWQIVVRDGDATTYVDGLGDAPTHGRILTALAPTILGTLGGLIVIGYVLLVDIQLPRSVSELAVWALAGIAWGMYSYPSRSDLETAAMNGSDTDE